MKKIIIILAFHFIALIVCFTAILLTPTDSSESKKESSEKVTTSVSQKEITEKHKKNKKKTRISAVITDEKLAENFEKACKDIDINPNMIVGLKKLSNWQAGPRYYFSYDRIPLYLYCNGDSTVHCIQINDDIKIYEEGYEPYSIKDYKPDSNISDELIAKTETYVKSHLNYPSTADFAILDWSCGRDHDLYSVSSYVEAKNGFGVESKINFRCIYYVSAKGETLVHAEIDGDVLEHKDEYFKKKKRKEIDSQKTSNGSTAEIVLTDGQLGKYGKQKNINGEKYINYCIPAGKYKVEAINYCTLYVAKDNYYKSSDGYMVNDIVSTYQLSDKKNCPTVTVKTGEHIEITINGKVRLTPVK